MARFIEGGDQTASQIQQSQLRKPVGERDVALMKSIAEAQADAHIINYQIQQAGKAAGLHTNGLKGEAIFDKKGNIVGYKVG